MKVYLDQGKEHALTKRMLPYWTKLGVELVPLADAQVHLSYVTFTVPSKIPKVLRLDGVYYNTMAPYIMENRPLTKAYREAQGIIFQSFYSSRVAQAFFGVLDPSLPTRIIYNGADPEWNDPLPHENFNIVLASHWRKWKRLEEMIGLLDEMVATYPEIRLHVVGTGKGLDLKGQHNYVKWYGDISHLQMRELYRKMDLALHIAKRDWCPNVVVEFTSAGIPTIVSDKGGGAVEIMKMIHDGFIALDDYDPLDVLPVSQYSKAWNALSPDFKTNVQSKIQLVMKGYLPRRICLMPAPLTSEYVAKEYYEFMKGVI